MALSKRERVIRTLELEEVDKIPIHYLGFEPTGTAYQCYRKSDEYKNLKTKEKWVRSITQFRFFNADCVNRDPFVKMKPSVRYFKFGSEGYTDFEIGEFVDYRNLKNGDFTINTSTGRVQRVSPHSKTDLLYIWYYDGSFRNAEFIKYCWENFGKPSELLRDTDYSPQIWSDYVENLSEYIYPMGTVMGYAMFESLFEGMTAGRMAYFMRKNPKLIHEIMREFTNTNLEIIKRLAEAGVDINFYYDDLGQKKRSILSLKNFREFILPYYKELYQESKKRGMFFIQHSCGYIDKFLPDMADAGLNCIQALEPAAGTDLAHLKETLGDRLSFMGGMDSSGTLNFGTPEDIEKDVKKCIKAAGQGGGYFAGPSHNILDVPWENLMALRSAIEKYRQYPLNF